MKSADIIYFYQFRKIWKDFLNWWIYTAHKKLEIFDFQEKFMENVKGLCYSDSLYHESKAFK